MTYYPLNRTLIGKTNDSGLYEFVVYATNAKNMRSVMVFSVRIIGYEDPTKTLTKIGIICSIYGIAITFSIVKIISDSYRTDNKIKEAMEQAFDKFKDIIEKEDNFTFVRNPMI